MAANATDSAAIRVKYSKFTLRQVLEYLLWKCKLEEKRRINTTVSTNWFDPVAEAVALSYGATIYVKNAVDGENKVYNTPRGGSLRVSLPSVYIVREDEHIVWDEGERFALAGLTYSEYSTAPKTDALVSVESDVIDKGSTEESMSGVSSSDKLGSGWYFDEEKGRFERSIKRANVVTSTPTEDENDLSDLDGSLVVLYPDETPVPILYIEGYSAEGMIMFPKVTLFDRTKINAQLLKIEEGLDICLLHKVTDLYFLDANYTPVAHLDVHRSVRRLLRKLAREGSAKITVIGEPLLESVKDLVEHDIAKSYGNLRVGGTVVDGECCYHYDNLRGGGVPKASTLNHLVESMDVKKYVLCEHFRAVPRREMAVCMSIHNLSYYLSCVENYLPTQRSAVYQCIAKFVHFLYKVGFGGEFPSYEDPLSAYRVYQNIQTFEIDMRREGGNVDLDTSGFLLNYLDEKRRAPVLRFRDGKEETTGLRYDF